MGWAPLDGWKWIFGLLGLLWLLSLIIERAREDGRGWRAVAPLIGLGLGTWVVRRVLVTPGFFQHVGRGADWICIARARTDRPYGPGFFEVFGALAELSPTAPDRALFEAQALLGACVPALAWLVVRFTSGRAYVAWAFALVIALHPGLARVCASESYYATCAFLLFGAAATLAVSTHRARPRATATWIGCLSASLLLAQALAVHPLSWVPAACVPFVALVGRGRTRRRFATFAVAMACFVVVGGGQLAMLLVAAMGRSESGAAGMTREMLLTRGGIAIPFISLLVLALVLARTRLDRRRRLRVAVLVGAVSTQVALQLIGLLDLPAAAAHAHAFLLAPVVLASVGSLAPTRAASRRLALGVATFTCVAVAPFAHDMLRLTTESLEANWLAAQRAELPAGAVVTFVHERDVIEMKLPLYGHCGLPGPRPLELENATAMPRTTRDAPLFYYRSSLCSTTIGFALCEARERSLTLAPVARTRLPAFTTKVRIRVDEDGMPRITAMRYREPAVEVALFRVMAVRR